MTAFRVPLRRELKLTWRDARDGDSRAKDQRDGDSRPDDEGAAP